MFAGSTAHRLPEDLSIPLVSARLLGLWPEGVAHILERPSPSFSVIAFTALAYVPVLGKELRRSLFLLNILSLAGT